MIDITVPADLADGGDDIVLLTWVYPDGAVVEQGALIAELMIAKAQLELVAPASGRLRILAPVDSVIRTDQVIARIEPVS
jgi:pyruvate/2-oxoglutarate dehydrogenase complex dihydrolipoamide acyltransferase (E2) component